MSTPVGPGLHTSQGTYECSVLRVANVSAAVARRTIRYGSAGSCKSEGRTPHTPPGAAAGEGMGDTPTEPTGCGTLHKSSLASTVATSLGGPGLVTFALLGGFGVERAGGEGCCYGVLVQASARFWLERGTTLGGQCGTRAQSTAHDRTWTFESPQPLKK